VLSDHGFMIVRRVINLNTWLVEQGFMKLRDGAGPGEYLESVDWGRTQAFAMGLGNIYLNLRGRERAGIVAAADAPGVKRRIVEGLTGLRDTDGAVAVRRVIDVQQTFRGPYTDDGPELIPGFAEGYRESWDCARGIVGPEVFEDNVRLWSGDHCMDPEIVPGVLFSSIPLAGESPRLMDVGPTVLDLLGVPVPRFMMGRSLA
jgi:predicted AlkP superfamily phosphohydrolase/phosphomutase